MIIHTRRKAVEEEKPEAVGENQFFLRYRIGYLQVIAPGSPVYLRLWKYQNIRRAIKQYVNALMQCQAGAP